MNKKYINKRSIAVLLSSYNGEKYITELIDSILTQTSTDFTLYIRDDMSNDKTPHIISQYQNSNDDKIVIIPSNQNLGSKSSFLNLLECVESEYYMFADQDDIWKKEKIEITQNHLKKIEKNHPNIPIVVHTDLQLVDGNLRPIADSYWEYCNVLVNCNYKYNYFCHYNNVTGCAMMFNNELKRVAKPFLNTKLPYFIHHDHYLTLICIANSGLIIPIFETPILFRRHGDNATNPLIKRKSILEKPTHIFNYIIDFYKRWLFFKNISAISLFSFIKGKLAVTYIRKKK